MISSPCKHCPNIDQPKDYCMENCPLIQALQTRAAAQVPLVAMALDYTEDMSAGLPANLLPC
ncbi:MAG: hypothetical protein WBG37_09255 [Desulfobacterales bacterium]